MPDNHELKLQNLVIDDVDLTTLAARTAVAVNSQFTSITATFLVKRIRYMLQASPMIIQDGPLVITIAKGGATVAEVNAAFTEHNSGGPDDVTQSLTEDNAWTVWQKSTRMFQSRNGDLSNAGHREVSGDFKLPGRGFPALEGAGIGIFVVNLGNNGLTTGIIVSGLVQLWGVWLRD